MSDSSSSVQTLNKVPNKQETASANSTPAPSTPANTTPSVPTASTNNTPAPSTPANSNPVPSTPASTTPSVPAASANTPSPTTNSNNAVLREDLIKPAVSFLSSPNVRSADKEKKISFLQKKGLNQAEIDEAFKRAGNGTVSTSNNTSTHQQNTLAPIVPARNVNYVPPQIVYYPQPPPPPVPAEKVFAMAVVLGMGAVGLTAGVIGLLRRFILPVFNRIAEYQRTRYNQRKEMADKLVKSLESFNTENDDLDALIDQGEEKTVSEALVKHQAELQDKLDRLLSDARKRLTTKNTTYGDFRDVITSFKSVIAAPDVQYSSYSSGYYMRNSSTESSAVSGLKSDIRSLKAVLLNRRNFPAV